MVEAITYLSPEMAPPTYQRGSHPFDGIFAAPQLLKKAASRYLSFGDTIPSDHRAIWLDLHLPEVCPIYQEVYIKPRAWWLQCKDPWIVDHYNTALLEMLEEKNLPQRISKINQKLTKLSDLWHNIKQELNSINNMIMEAKHGAENHCRKLKCGQVQWCPQVTAAISHILFWKGILKWELGGKVGLSVLKKAKKAGIDQVPYIGTVSTQEVKALITKAYKKFCDLKKDKTQRDTWIAQLIQAQSEAWNQSKKTLWKQLRCMEQIRKTVHNVCCALHKLHTHNPLALVAAPGSSSDTRQEYHQKVELEKACLEEAGRCFTQAKHTPLLMPPLVDIFGECGNPKEVAQLLAGDISLPANSNKYALKLLAELSWPPGMTDIPPWSTQETAKAGKKHKKQPGPQLLGSTSDIISQEHSIPQY